MDKLILERGFLIDCKNKIMQGQSIRSLAEEVHIDRKTLRKKILAILSEEEKEEFQKVLSNNFRKNRKSARTIKKEQREENFNYGCISSNGGRYHGCFGKILNDNWEMNY